MDLSFFIGKIMNERQQKYFKRLKQYISKKGGKCLSKNYVDNNTKLKFKCDKNHIWETKPKYVINSKTWCPICGISKIKSYFEPIRLRNYEKLKKYVFKKEGKCLSKKYINSVTKMKFKCKKGHIWETTPHILLIHKRWCPTCGFDKRRKKISDIIKCVENKGGRLLTKKYKNDLQKLQVKCSKGHTWKTNYCGLRSGSWCPSCNKESRYLTTKEKLEGFNLICEIAKNKGGKCLSSIKHYKNIRSKLKFQCTKKHKWTTMGTTIKTNNKWCPICSQSLSEKLFRCVLEKVFNQSFPSIRPSWLKSDKNRKLQIDGYNEKLKFGFEHQGEQHFRFKPFFHKTIEAFERRLLNDSLKASILKEKNIFMLYPTYKLKKENYFNYIKTHIKNTPYSSLANFNQKIDINELYKYI